MSLVSFKTWGHKMLEAEEPFVSTKTGDADKRGSLKALLTQAFTMLYTHLLLSPSGPRKTADVGDDFLDKTVAILSRALEVASGLPPTGRVFAESLTEYASSLRAERIEAQDLKSFLENLRKNEGTKRPRNAFADSKQAFSFGPKKSETTVLDIVYDVTDTLASTITQLQSFRGSNKATQRAEFAKTLNDCMFAILIDYVQFRAQDNGRDFERAAQNSMFVLGTAAILADHIAMKAAGAKDLDQQDLLGIEKMFFESQDVEKAKASVQKIPAEDLENPNLSLQDIVKRENKGEAEKPAYLIRDSFSFGQPRTPSNPSTRTTPSNPSTRTTPSNPSTPSVRPRQ